MHPGRVVERIVGGGVDPDRCRRGDLVEADEHLAGARERELVPVDPAVRRLLDDVLRRVDGDARSDPAARVIPVVRSRLLLSGTDAFWLVPLSDSA